MYVVSLLFLSLCPFPPAAISRRVHPRQPAPAHGFFLLKGSVSCHSCLFRGQAPGFCNKLVCSISCLNQAELKWSWISVEMCYNWKFSQMCKDAKLHVASIRCWGPFVGQLMRGMCEITCSVSCRYNLPYESGRESFGWAPIQQPQSYLLKDSLCQSCRCG